MFKRFIQWSEATDWITIIVSSMFFFDPQASLDQLDEVAPQRELLELGTSLRIAAPGAVEELPEMGVEELEDEDRGAAGWTGGATVALAERARVVWRST